MPSMFIQPDEPDPNAEPGSRAFRLAVLSGYCSQAEAAAILDAIDGDSDSDGAKANVARRRTIAASIDASFVLAIACEALDRQPMSHHDLVSALERVGVDPNRVEGKVVTFSAVADPFGDRAEERERESRASAVTNPGGKVSR